MNFSSAENYKKTSLILLIVILFVGVAGLQSLHNDLGIEPPENRTGLSADFLRLVDLGLHATLASFLWVDVRTHLPFLRRGLSAFKNDFNVVTELNPRFAEPYAFSVIVLPHVDKEGTVDTAIDIGIAGIEKAEPADWRISFYTAAALHIYKQDYTEAAKYFDIASRTAGIPDEMRRFALNYSLLRDVRDAGKRIWNAIYEEADNETTKQRALDHIEHIEVAQALDRAVDIYRERFGFYPAEPQDLVEGGVIRELPETPLDVEWRILDDGRVGVKN